MKISFRYDDGVAVVPKKVLDKSAAQASREDLLVLLSLAAPRKGLQCLPQSAPKL